ncbi:TraR/DksA family transcriptional regulator [Ectothiorhodospira mobilis]|uniref:TraR/DksA family transcriptional regulator n=1 Tax=Ectothiorhodospira mobilis TaxID=195064 RepID=UPI001EE89C3F|nr:TraR/DksA family transcriptional regulator [Ectothiorhodospira mobilis]MCG5536076.1 TraR/DksA family transcriptional regulator [Ectothiorhodospira mobilis]
MRNEDDIQHFRQRLEAELAQLEGTAGTRRSGADTVELDQSRTGRLSRMDALQGQAMARATEARAVERLRRIQAALRRMEAGEYGECVDCGESIARGRLEANPAVTRCIHCAEKAEG